MFNGSTLLAQKGVYFLPRSVIGSPGWGTIGTTRLCCCFLRHFRLCLTVLEKESSCTANQCVSDLPFATSLHMLEHQHRCATREAGEVANTTRVAHLQDRYPSLQEGKT